MSFDKITVIIGLVITFLALLFGENILGQFFEKGQDSLTLGDKYLKEERYIDAYNAYASDALYDNEIALNNLGYLYSKGLGVEQNMGLAKKYYRRASEKGNSVAFSNLIILNLKNPEKYEEILDLLQAGYNKNELNVLAFLEYSLKDFEVWKKYGIITAEEFFKLDPYEQRKILNVTLYKEIILSRMGEVLQDNDFCKVDNSFKKESMFIGYQKLLLESTETGESFDCYSAVYGVIDVAGAEKYHFRGAIQLNDEQPIFL